MTTTSQVSGYPDSRNVKGEESFQMFVPTYSKSMVEEPVDPSIYLSSGGGGIREINGYIESKSLSQSQSFFDWETAPERKRESKRFVDVIITVCSTESVALEKEESAVSEEEESDEGVLEYPPNQDDNTKAIIIEDLPTESSGDELSSWQSTSSLKKERDLPNQKERSFSKEGVCAGVESGTTLVEVEAASSTSGVCGIGDVMCGVPLLKLFGWYKNDDQINELIAEKKNISCDDTVAESYVGSSDEESTDIDSTDAESIPSDEGPGRRQKVEQQIVGLGPSDNNGRKQNDNSDSASRPALATLSSTSSHTNIHKACNRAPFDEDESTQDQSMTSRPRVSFDEELLGDETISFSADEQEPKLKQKSVSFEIPQNDSADSERQCYGVTRYLQLNAQLEDEDNYSNSVSGSSSVFSLAAESFEISSASGSEYSEVQSSLLSSGSSSGDSMASSSLLGPRLV